MNDAPDLKAAREWLDAWASIGGGVTISAAGIIHPWRVTHIDEQRDWGRRCAKAEVAEKMLGQLLTHPDWHQPIRVILSTSARRMAAPGIAQIKDRKQ